MSKKGPIVIVEDDEEECSRYKISLKNIGVVNKLVFFDNEHDTLEYLQTTKETTFIIISDLKTAKIDGINLRERINNNPYLRRKAIPFIFYTKDTNEFDINKAYDLNVQGYFKRSGDRMNMQLKLIMDYWKECLEPLK
jgi:CheY-like chemotaxis protein